MMLLLFLDVLKLTYDMPAIQPSLRDCIIFSVLTLQRHFVSRGASMNHRCRPGPPTRRRLGAAGLQNVAVVLTEKESQKPQ